jgi:hypothetical protein
MSLLDTIKGAKEEAQEAGGLIATGKKDASEKSNAAEADASQSSSGFSRKSAARAKPRREAAGSVRVESSSKPESQMTKEEKKAARDKRRSEEDLIFDAKRAVLNQMPEYQRSQKIWWGLLIAGIVCTVVAWGVLQQINANNIGQGYGAVTAITMVVAYVLVIGAFIFDIWKVRPMRKAADEQVAGMSKRRMQRVIEEEEARKAAKKAKK